MWGRKEKSSPTATDRRIQRIPSAELGGWADQTLFSLNRMMASWAHNRDPLLLDEASDAANVLVALLDEMRKRNV